MRRLEDEMGEVVEALAAGRRVSLRADAWQLGGRALPGEVVRALTEAGLVAAEGGALLLLPAGRRLQAAARTGRVRVQRTIPAASDAGQPERPGAAGRPQARRTVTVAVGEAPLGWLRARGLLASRQFEAGERLAADWTRAQLSPSVTMRWDAVPGGSSSGGARQPLHASEAQVAARARFDAAVGAVGPGLADVLWRVACAGEGLEAAERALGWPGRSGKVVLGIALDRLADHYRLPAGPPPSTNR